MSSFRRRKGSHGTALRKISPTPHQFASQAAASFSCLEILDSGMGISSCAHVTCHGPSRKLVREGGKAALSHQRVALACLPACRTPTIYHAPPVPFHVTPIAGPAGASRPRTRRTHRWRGQRPFHGQARLEFALPHRRALHQLSSVAGGKCIRGDFPARIFF